MVPQCGVAKIDVAAFHAPGQEGAVGVFDDAVGHLAGFLRVFFHHGFDAEDGTVHRRAFCHIGDHPAVLKTDVRTHDHAHVVQFQALAGVDAANLVDGILGNDPGAAVFGQVPAHEEVVLGKCYVAGRGILLADPVPAIAGHQAGFVCLVVCRVLIQDEGPELRGGVNYAEIKFFRGKPDIGRFFYLEGVFKPGQVAVRSVAPELGFKFQPLYFCAFAFCPAGNKVGFANVFDVDLLVVVYKEYGAFGGPDQFQYLVLSPVLIKPAFQVQAVGLVHYECIECVLWYVAVISTPPKEVVYHPLFKGASQLGLVNGPRGCVLGYVPGDLSPLGKLGQQVHGHHAFACSRATFHYQDHFFVAAGLSGQGKRRLINPLLLINHNELPVAPDHGSDAVCQLFGRPQAAVLYPVQDVLIVAVLDKFLDELPEFYGIGFQKNGCLAYVVAVEGVGDDVVRVVVVQVGAGHEVDLFVPDGHVIAFYKCGVGPGLVGGVYGLGFPVLETGADHGILVCQLGRGPLLEFNDDDLFLLFLVQAGNDKIYSIGSQRDLEFYGDSCVCGYFVVHEHVAHMHHGIGPRQDLVGRRVPSQVVVKGLVDLGVNLVTENIFQKTFLSGLVNYHSSIILIVRYTFWRFHGLFPGGIFVRS